MEVAIRFADGSPAAGLAFIEYEDYGKGMTTRGLGEPHYTDDSGRLVLRFNQSFRATRDVKVAVPATRRSARFARAFTFEAGRDPSEEIVLPPPEPEPVGVPRPKGLGRLAVGWEPGSERQGVMFFSRVGPCWERLDHLFPRSKNTIRRPRPGTTVLAAQQGWCETMEIADSEDSLRHPVRVPKGEVIVSIPQAAPFPYEGVELAAAAIDSEGVIGRVFRTKIPVTGLAARAHLPIGEYRLTAIYRNREAVAGCVDVRIREGEAAEVTMPDPSFGTLLFELGPDVTRTTDLRLIGSDGRRHDMHSRDFSPFTWIEKYPPREHMPIYFVPTGEWIVQITTEGCLRTAVRAAIAKNQTLTLPLNTRATGRLRIRLSDPIRPITLEVLRLTDHLPMPLPSRPRVRDAIDLPDLDVGDYRVTARDFRDGSLLFEQTAEVAADSRSQITVQVP